VEVGPLAKALTEIERRNLMVAESNLTALSQHPAWETLRAEAARHEQAIEKIVLARALRSSKKLSPEEQGYFHGFIAGMNWFLKVPAGAESRLERFLRKHPIATEEEEDG
jgi:hypothetical protein